MFPRFELQFSFLEQIYQEGRKKFLNFKASKANEGDLHWVEWPSDVLFSNYTFVETYFENAAAGLDVCGFHPANETSVAALTSRVPARAGHRHIAW